MAPASPTGERVGGLRKTCYYDCGAREDGLEDYIHNHCPGWTVRRKLNRNSQFGPGRHAHTRKT